MLTIRALTFLCFFVYGFLRQCVVQSGGAGHVLGGKMLAVSRGDHDSDEGLGQCLPCCRAESCRAECCWCNRLAYSVPMDVQRVRDELPDSVQPTRTYKRHGAFRMWNESFALQIAVFYPPTVILAVLLSLCHRLRESPTHLPSR